MSCQLASKKDQNTVVVVAVVEENKGEVIKDMMYLHKLIFVFKVYSGVATALEDITKRVQQQIEVEREPQGRLI